MECLWMRRFGTPKWNVSHDFMWVDPQSSWIFQKLISHFCSETRTYPEGWNTDDGRDSTLEYRLELNAAEAQDSGDYTCTTPARHFHTIHVEVKAVHCEEITPRRGLVLSTTSTQMSTKVQFSCNNGNALIGTPEITCLGSGNWSSPLPICESELNRLLESWYSDSFYFTIPSRRRMRRHSSRTNRQRHSTTCCNNFTWSWRSCCIQLSSWLRFKGSLRGNLSSNWWMGWSLPILLRGTMLPSWLTGEWIHARTSAI